MNPEKFIDLQRQMHENNLELRNFLDGFDDWKESVEAKNSKLEISGTINKETNLPPIRNSMLQKKKRKKEKPAKPSRRIRSTDYQAWDKLDPDTAFDSSSSDEGDRHKHKSTTNGASDANGGANNSSSETDEEFEEDRRKHLAHEARELGNVRFKRGRLDEAIEEYTKAIRLTPDDPTPYTNRALAQIKLERFKSAETDCTVALSLDPASVKALFRRALACKGLNNPTSAINDLERLIKLDAKNSAALKLLNELRPPSQPTLSKSAKSTASASSPPPMLRRMRRIPIIDIDEPPSTNNGQGLVKPQPSGDHHPATGKINQTRQASVAIVNNHPHLPDIVASSSPNPSLPIPTNWFQLERQLRELTSGGSGKQLSQPAIDYLIKLPPSCYSQVIGSNLDPSLLTRLLRAFTASQLTPADIAQRLISLSQLPRFDVACLMLDASDRAATIDQLIGRLDKSSKDEVSVDMIADIKQMYL